MANVVATLVVTLSDDGKIEVNGNATENLLLGYGLCDVAKDVIKEMNKPNIQKIVEPSAADRAALNRDAMRLV